MSTQDLCACCGDSFDSSLKVYDADLGGFVCPDCKKQLRAATAILRMPCDDLGRKINLRGCYSEPDAPDNLH